MEMRSSTLISPSVSAAIRASRTGRALEMRLRYLGNASHYTNSFHRISAGSRFFGEHDTVRAIQDSVGYVRHFGTGGAPVIDHGFEHLGGGDDRLSPLSWLF